jgi:hypothetical protein
VTEGLDRAWYERNTGNAIKDIQRQVNHPVIRWLAAAIDGVVEGPRVWSGGLRPTCNLLYHPPAAVSR